MKTKSPPCCARLESKLIMDKAELARVARRAARVPEQRRYQDEIVAMKAKIAETKRTLEAHEADHAAEGR